MATDSYTPTGAVDVVGVFDQDNYTQLFDKAQSVRARINEQSMVMTHPVENGVVIADHTIIQPVEIELSCILSSDDYKNVYESILKVRKDATLVTVHTRAKVYSNMLIQAIPHDEDTEVFTGLSMVIKLKEVQFATVTTSVVSSPADAKHTDSKDAGKQQPSDATSATKKQSILSEWFS